MRYVRYPSLSYVKYSTERGFGPYARSGMQGHSRGNPPPSNMNTNKKVSRRPAKAVWHPAKGLGPDGDGGGTAGTPPVGEEATGPLRGDQLCESLLPLPCPRGGSGTNCDPPTPEGASGGRQSRAPKGPKGTDPNGAGTARHPPIKLRRRKVRIGTWNMNGQTSTRSGQKVAKLPVAEDLMALEQIDILVLTETHAQQIRPSRKTRLMAETGINLRQGGVAILTNASHSWQTIESRTLIPGYALLTTMENKTSRETIKVLGVYGDISNSHTSLEAYYRNLRNKLADVIDGDASWDGCTIAGDWNMSPDPGRAYGKKTMDAYGDVLTLCQAEETPHRAEWTIATATQNGTTYSRLDRIYFQRSRWSAGVVTTLGTTWSDHSLVYTDMYKKDPVIQQAKPAPRMPDCKSLEESTGFWKHVLNLWDQLQQTRPATLENWTRFKTQALEEGVAAKKRTREKKAKAWKAALRGDAVPPEELEDVLKQARLDEASKEKRTQPRDQKWPPAVQGYGQARRRKPRQEPSPWTQPDQRSRKPRPDTPPAQPPMANRNKIAALLDKRLQARREATVRRMKEMERKRTSEWFSLANTREADERGSRASVSMSGLRKNPNCQPETSLAKMTDIARSYFQGLHTPMEVTPGQRAAQATLLSELQDQPEVAATPAEPPPEGAFLEEEVRALAKRMPATAPGPDGIHYPFWKALAKKLDKLNEKSGTDATFWATFTEVANDAKSRGTSRCGFKDANLSLFYKKGDPTLTENYRPISSMNTDCKMYTNLVNARLSAWAVHKLHPDQKGFVPGRYITEHTRLASEVDHMCNALGVKGFIVSLDQSKAYDRVDLPWLLKVLTALKIPKDLVDTIEDHTKACKTRVRINSGYSRPFTLRRGVRQGDPLSCLLFNFSLEPTAAYLRRRIHGLSIPGAPTVRMTLYADDMNLFLGYRDKPDEVSAALDYCSLATGALLNKDKTEVKPVGPDAFRQLCHSRQDMAGPPLPGARILAPDTPIRILGVWVGDRTHAAHRWKNISAHIIKLIDQWTAIGASILNRVVLAKALLQSRCYYLMDGNGIPKSMLRRLSNKIQAFVRGRFSRIPYDTVSAPLDEGGLGCPSLSLRSQAYDIKMIGDLISGSQLEPWRVWTRQDLRRATTAGDSGQGRRLNPLTQQGYTKVSKLEPRLAQAFSTARTLGLDLQCAMPSPAARDRAPATHHPAIRKTLSRGTDCLPSHGIHTVKHLRQAAAKANGCDKCIRKSTTILRALGETNWDPLRDHTTQPAHDSVRIWPNMKNVAGCIKFCTAPTSLLTRHDQVRAHARGTARTSMTKYKNGFLAPELVPYEPLFPSPTSIWTDGSAESNGLESCTAGAAWTSDVHTSGGARLRGPSLSNNIAEVAAVMLALRAWRGSDINIHTDSTFVLGLVKGGLLAMERDGWPSHPPLNVVEGKAAPTLTPFFKYLLFLLRSHTGSLTFSKVKAHSGVLGNEEADRLAAAARRDGEVWDITNLTTPLGWVDDNPTLNYMTLRDITAALVRKTIPAPSTTGRLSPFTSRWTVHMYRKFGVALKVERYMKAVWAINIPTGLREILWKDMNDALPIGHKAWGREPRGSTCECGSPLTLEHILAGCRAYDTQPAWRKAADLVYSTCPGLSCKTLTPDEWAPHYWYPLLALKRLESEHVRPTKAQPKPSEALAGTRSAREWIIGQTAWSIWKVRMSYVNDEQRAIPWSYILDQITTPN